MKHRAMHLDGAAVLVAVVTMRGQLNVSCDLEPAAGARLYRMTAAALLNRADQLDAETLDPEDSER